MKPDPTIADEHAWWKDHLRRLHDGPMQEGAALKVALALWESAGEQGDTQGAATALDLVRQQLTRLLEGLAALEREGHVHLASQDTSATQSPASE
ncbi:MAG: hypothetical protein CL878_09030 [Dehalococcoidia bacterium]|nr:hypothetical protein [Dehalococcoidia bacterium]